MVSEFCWLHKKNWYVFPPLCFYERVHVNLFWTPVFEITECNSCIKKFSNPHNMDSEANCSITHPYTSINILFPDIIIPTGLETICIIIWKNITFIKHLLEVWLNLKVKYNEVLPLGHYKYDFKSQTNLASTPGLQLSSCVSLGKLLNYFGSSILTSKGDVAIVVRYPKHLSCSLAHGISWKKKKKKRWTSKWHDGNHQIHMKLWNRMGSDGPCYLCDWK